MSTSSSGKSLSTYEKRQLLAELLRKKAAAEVTSAPLTYGQKALLYLERANPGSRAYNAVIAIKVVGYVNVAALRHAFQKVVDRHAIFRTTYGTENDDLVQRIQGTREIDFEAIDAMGASLDDLEARWMENASYPYALDRDMSLRVRFYSRAAAEHVLVIGVHHIAFDYWSYDVLARELQVFYQGATTGVLPQIKPLHRQFGDYARAQEAMLAGPRGAQLWEYWRRELAGDIPAVQLPLDKPRPAQQKSAAATFSFQFSPALFRGLRTLARECQTTPYVLFVAALQVLLHRYSNEDDIVIGSPMACRDSVDTEDIIGYFTNMVALRASLSGNPSFTALLGQVHRTVMGALEHQEFPFALLVDKLGCKPDPSRQPLFDVALTWDKSHARGIGHEGPLQLELMFARQLGAPYDLTVFVFETAEDLSATLLYNSELFEASTVIRIAGHLQTLLNAVVTQPATPVALLPLIAEGERRQMLVEWNQTASSPSAEPTIVHLFEQQVRRSPDATAVVFGDRELNYRQLNERANQLAHCLRDRGVGPEVLVALCVERSPEMLIALLGIMKAGGAYVPLDASYPRERLTYLLADCQASILVSTRDSLPTSLQYDKEVIYLDDEAAEISQQPADNPAIDVGPHNLAYVIYTSGSTGKPKGVLLEHGGLRNVAEAQFRLFELCPQDRVLQFASLSFDASIFEIVMAIRAGGALCLGTRESLLPGPALRDFLRRHAVSVVTLPPTALGALDDGDFPCLRLITVAGEACPSEVVSRWSKGRRFFNLYGPTETTIWATYAQCIDDGQRPPIGRPILNSAVFVLDRNSQPVPIGVAGELHIGGIGLARGYHCRPELEAERFVPNPFSSEGGARLYKTGDLVRYRHSGDLEFLGRLDHQVKIRGLRIELGEIEAFLADHPAVSNCAVLLRQDVPGYPRLVAYVFPRSQPGPTVAELRSHLKARLPEYMVPSVFVNLPEMPLSPNGKIDRRALLVQELVDDSAAQPFVAPESDVEQVIAAIWQRALKIERVGRFDNFFDLGGHSLLLAKVHEEMQQATGTPLELVDIFRFPTVHSIAAHVSRSDAEARSFDDVRERARQQRMTRSRRMPAQPARRSVS